MQFETITSTYQARDGAHMQIGTPTRTMTLAGCLMGMREYPRVGMDVGIDTTNHLAHVRDPNYEDMGMAYRIQSLL